MNTGGIADWPLLRILSAIHQKSWEPSFWEVMDCFVLVASGSLAASRILLQQLLACVNFTLDSEDLFFWYKWKKVISMKCGSSTSCWKPWRWMRFDVILTMRDLYINSTLNLLTKFTSTSRSTEFKDILPWNISQMIMKTFPISTKIVMSYAMKGGILFWIYWKVNGNWDKNMTRISQQRESHCRANTNVSRKNKFKRAGLRESQLGIWVGKLTIWVRSFEIEKL